MPYVATYFDGYSSVPHTTELKLDANQGLLLFDTPYKSEVSWKVEDISYEKYGNLIEIRNTFNKKEIIKVNDAVFVVEFLKVLKDNGKISLYKRFVGLGFKIHLSIVASLAVLGIIFYFVMIPWVSEKAVQIIPDSYDTSLGNSFYNEYRSTYAIDKDKTLALNKFASQLQLNNKRPLYFTVINSQQINAFALPNGNIIVFTGLLDAIQQYDELACLIGHEVIHVNQRHSMKMLCRNLSGYLFLSVIMGDANGVNSIITNNAHNLQSLSYSRQFEKEADEQGTELMMRNNINPQGMTTLFRRLKLKEKTVVPAFASTHPLTDDRISDIDHLIKLKKYNFVKNTVLESLFQAIKKSN
jgi:Zn-dependent protease with chaperone function